MDHKLMEDNLQKIESVVSSKIVFGDGDCIDEIHLVANGHRGPKQIARDVQSILLATYDVSVDHKKISIAQILDDTLKRKASRVKLDGVLRETLDSRATIKITVSLDNEEYTSSKSGVNSARNIDRMLVETTLDVVQQASDFGDIFLFDDIRQVPVAGTNIVVICVTGIIGGTEHRLCGVSVIDNDYNKAVVKATLDAVNRFITK
ncbi:MAG: hypothetical protein ACQEP4_06170 [Bacillota bacterium]